MENVFTRLQKLRNLRVEFLNHPFYCHLKNKGPPVTAGLKNFSFRLAKNRFIFTDKVNNKLYAAQFPFAMKSSPSDENKLREYVKFNHITRVWSQCTCGFEASLVAWINHGCNQRGAAVSGSLQTPGTALLWGKAVCSGESAPFQCSAAALQCFKSRDK